MNKCKKKVDSPSTISGIVTIPVVVHVIYNNEEENISDEQIMSQIEVLNEDFRRMNMDADDTWPQSADTEIEFCLSSRDPFGDATCGITRTYTDSTKFKRKQSMKYDASRGKSGWDRSQYLNIWVCDIDGLLGFATFPNNPNRDEDGVVVDYLNFGRIGNLKPDFNLGRTATHEVGHWLGLRHIWGDGDCSFDDSVDDTPWSDDPNYDCNVGHISCSSVDMVQNYMDYSDDACMNLFTMGQKLRMRALFEPGGFKEAFLTSKACQAPLDCNQITIKIRFDNYPGDISWNFKNPEGSIIASGSGYTNSLAHLEETIYDSCVADGSYTFEIFDAFGDGLCCNEGSGSYLISDQYGDLLIGDGDFGSSDLQTVNLLNSSYRFVGPGDEWEISSNWNKLSVPSSCYSGVICIESDCIKNDGLDIYSPTQLIVKEGVQFCTN